MASLRFDLVSPERLLVSAEVDSVDVPGSEGDFGVFAGHAPVMTTLKPGVVSVQRHGKTLEKYFVRGGFVEVTPQGLVVLAEEAFPLAELDAAVLDRQIADAEEDLADAKDNASSEAAKEAVRKLRELRQSLS